MAKVTSSEIRLLARVNASQIGPRHSISARTLSKRAAVSVARSKRAMEVAFAEVRLR